MLNKHNIPNKISESINHSSEVVLKVANKVSDENKRLISQLSQKTYHAIKSRWGELLRTSDNEAAATWRIQCQAKSFYAPNNVIGQDNECILIGDKENLEDQLKKMREIILSDKNKGLNFKNKDFLLQIDRLLEELKETRGILANRWSIIHSITNSLFLFFTKEKFDTNKKNLIAEILLIIMENNNLAVDQVRLIKKFNKYLNTSANPELNNFVKELDKLQSPKQINNAAFFVREIKQIVSLLNKINYNFSFSLEEKLEKKVRKKIKIRTINFDREGIGYCVEDRYKKPTPQKKNIRSLEKVDSEKIECSGKSNLGETELPDKSSLEGKKYSLDNEQLFVILMREIVNIEQDEIIQGDKTEKINLTIDVEEELKKSLEPFLSSIKFNVENAAYFTLPHFEESNNDLLDNFLNYISFKDFRELMITMNRIFFYIKKEILPILTDIDDFLVQFGSDDRTYYEHYRSFEEKRLIFRLAFNKENMENFLKNSIKLFVAHRLNSKKIDPIIHFKSNKEFKEIKFDNELIFNNFIYFNKLESTIEKQEKDIKFYIEQHLKKDVLFNDFFEKNESHYDSNASKYFFEKIKKIIINIFKGNNCFFTLKNKCFFINEIKKNIKDELSFSSVNNFILRLKWWHFIFYGINPFCAYKKEFKRKLSEHLFYHLIAEDFKDIKNSLKSDDENKKLGQIEGTTHHHAEQRIEYTDKLFAIIDRLKSLSQNNRYTMETKYKSRSEIIDELNKNVINELPGKLFRLKEQANLLLRLFSERLNILEKEVEALEPVKKARNNNSFLFNGSSGLGRQSNGIGTNSKISFSRQGAS